MQENHVGDDLLTAVMEMGFAPERIEWALRSTNATLEAALDHIEMHQDEPVPPDATSPVGDDAESSETAVPQSIKCNVCNKQFRDMDLAKYHADKSGHEDFSESAEAIKPLSPEEREKRLAELREKAALRRSAQEAEYAKDQRANEMIRRKAGQEAVQAREELERKERIKEAEKKRRERLEDMAAKERVRRQIEEDKQRRAEKAAREKELRQGVQKPAAPAVPLAAQLPKVSAHGTETRLRVRAPGGIWMGTLSVDATLNDVEKAVLSDGKGGSASSLAFSTTFPRKTYTSEECSQTLQALGLYPNAALEAQ